MRDNERGFLDPHGDELLIAGRPVSWWVNEFQPPLHINYAPLIRRNLRSFINVFEDHYPNGGMRYAAKACAHPALFKVVAEEGAGADVASYNEAKCALDSGIAPALLVVNGNCKEDALIETAIDKDMLIAADSIEEFQIVSQTAKNMGRTPGVILRISGFDLGNVTAASIFTAGAWSKFGAHLEDVPEFIKRLDEHSHVRFLGFHTHIGSQIADVEPYQVVLGKLVELGILLQNSGRECRVINIGGGFPVSYIDEDQWNYILGRIREGIVAAQAGDFSRVFVWNNQTAGFAVEPGGRIDPNNWDGEKFYSEYAKARMMEAILSGEISVNGKTTNAVKALRDLGEPELLIEPGRSIVGDTGVTLARVSHVKTIAGHHNLVCLEAGITSYALAMVGIPMNRWALANDYWNKDSKSFEAFITGNLCFNGDMISRYKTAFQRKPKRGDIVVAYDTGAYSPHYFAANSNSFPRPARVVADHDGEISVLKRRDTYEDIFSL